VGQVDGPITRMTPLVDQLQQFCLGHEQRDGGAAGAEMLAHLRQDWPEIADVSMQADPEDGRDSEELALSIIRDVGEVADILLSSDPEERLAWSRANLIVDLERYAVSIEQGLADGSSDGRDRA
jgi:hypothetical protein